MIIYNNLYYTVRKEDNKENINRERERERNAQVAVIVVF